MPVKFSALEPGTPERGGILPPAPSQGSNRSGGAFYIKSIIGNFMADQDRLETNSLQLFAHSEKSE